MSAKTNVMRLLEEAHINYRELSYTVDPDDLSALHAHEQLGLPAEQIFKTLVLVGASGGHFVFCIPSNAELDLKKAAKTAGEKNIAMLHVKELLPLTGYVRGGCSPIGMKKKFPTFIDETAQLFDAVTVSAGKRGLMVMLSPTELAAYVEAPLADVTA